MEEIEETDKLALQAFLAPLVHRVTETYAWPLARFAVNTYLHPTAPPISCITSVRAVVLRDHAVLVVRDPTSYHILPGGRREAGESLAETVTREVLEETGWQIELGALLGFKHFHRLTPAPAEMPLASADFTQLVYVASAVTYCPEAMEQDGYELGAEFVPLNEIAQVALMENERLFLQTALAVTEIECPGAYERRV